VEEKELDLRNAETEITSQSSTRNLSERVMDVLERSFQRYPTGESLELVLSSVAAYDGQCADRLAFKSS